MSAFKANNISFCIESAIALSIGLFNSLKIAINLTILAPLCSFNKWHNINNYPEIALHMQLAKQRALILDFIYLYTLSLCLSSKLLHNRISIKGLRYTRFEAITSSLSPLLCYCKALLKA